jgi:hypothetical protein
VLLPAGMALTGEERRLAIAHELMHVRRHDVALGWIPALAERWFFFHPLVRFAAREYVTAREAACDAAVVQALELEPADYGRVLVRFGVAGAVPAFVAGGASATASSLRRRLDMLQNVTSRRSRRLAWSVAALLVVAMVPMEVVARGRVALPEPAPLVTASNDMRGTPRAVTEARSYFSQAAAVAPVQEPVRVITREQIEKFVTSPTQEIEYLKQRLAEAEAALRQMNANESPLVALRQSLETAAADLAQRQAIENETREVERLKMLEQRARQAVADNNVELAARLEIMQKQMDALRAQMRELERALNLQRREQPIGR